MAAYPSVATRARRGALLAGCAALIPAAPAFAQGFVGGHSVAAGAASVNDTAGTTTVTVTSPTAIIDWGATGAAVDGVVDFLPAGNTAIFQGASSFTVLNRVLPSETGAAIGINGHVRGMVGGATGGNVWFYNPGGIVAGATSVFDVGGLVLTANDPGTMPDLSAGATFTAAADSTAAVEVMAGARINALANGSYVALVAPRVVQGGEVQVRGAAAYVAAEQATLSFNSGLFNVAVTIGSDAADPSGNTLVHSGTTGGPAAGAADPRRAYLVAVPKNDAITMLVGGSLGFAAGAHTENGVVVLDAGYDIADQTPGAAHNPADIRVSGASFTAAVVARGTGDFLAVSGGADDAVSFARGLDVGVAGDIALRAVGTDAQITGAGGQKLRATTPGDSEIQIEAGYGGGIAFTGLLVADTSAATSIAGEDISGGAISLSAYGGGRFSLGATELDSHATGGNATAGNVSISAGGGGAQSTIASLNIFASGTGGASGAGNGGTVSLSLDDNGLAITNSAFIDTHGQGGTGGGVALENGGNGNGGSVSLSSSGPFSAGNTIIDAHGAGGDGGLATLDNGAAGIGGDGNGGIVSLSPGGALHLGELSVDATGHGGDGGVTGAAGGNGGSGFGGYVNVETGSGAILGAVELDASGFGGAGAHGAGPYGDPADTAGSGGDGIGGGSHFSSFGGNTTLASLRLIATAEGGAGASAEGPVTNGGAGGAGLGGDASLDIDGGTLKVTGATRLDISATGGAGGAGPGSDGDGGAADIVETSAVVSASDGSTTQLATLEVLANATGGDSGGLSSGIGGQAQAGAAHVTGGGQFSTTGNVTISASALGGGGLAETGGATGGDVALQGGPGGQLTVGGAATLRADAQAGALLGEGFAVGGSAQGGNVTLSTQSGFFAFEAGYGSGQVSIAGLTLLSAQSLGQAAAIGGSALGGFITVDNIDGGTLTLTGAVTVNGRAVAGHSTQSESDGAEAQGASFTLTAANESGVGGATAIGALSIDTSGRAGDNAGGAAAGSAFGGAVSLATESGYGATTLAIGALDIDSSATGGQANGLSGGRGGDGYGGTIGISAAGGAVTLATLDVDSRGTGGAGANALTGNVAGDGGLGTGGAVQLLAQSKPLTVSGAVTLDARATGGAGGTVQDDPMGDMLASVSGNGGAAQGGAITVSTGSGALKTGAFTAHGDAEGGDAGDTSFGVPGSGGQATAGNMDFATDGASLTMGNLILTAGATGGDGGFISDPFSHGSIGGAATGGIVNFNTSGAVTLGAISVMASAAGGGASGMDGGDGSERGGDASGGGFQLSLFGAAAKKTGAITLDLTAQGGSGTDGAGGGNAQGGDATIQSGDGAASIQGALLANLGATGGANGSSAVGPSLAAGDAQGGTATIFAGSGTIAIAGAATIHADADGGAANAGPLGNATGGSIAITASGGGITLSGPLLATADAATHVGTAAAVTDGGGLAQGGGIILAAQSGAAVTVHGDATLRADAVGADALPDPDDGPVAGADGFGGSVAVEATGGTLALDGDLALSATGRGGEPSGGDFAGEGRGGSATILINDPDGGPGALEAGGAVSLDASGLAAAAEGIVTPGTVAVTIDSGTFSAASLMATDGQPLPSESPNDTGFQGDIATSGEATVQSRVEGHDEIAVGSGVPVLTITPGAGDGGDIDLLPYSRSVSFSGGSTLAVLNRVEPAGGPARVLLNGGITGGSSDAPRGEVALYNAGGIRAGSGADLRARRIVLTTDPDYLPSLTPTPTPTPTPIPPTGGAFQGTPTLVSGDVTFTRTPELDTITVGSAAAIVDWAVADGAGTVDFLPAGLTGLFQNDPARTADFTILNRILPGDASRAIAFNGTVRSRLTRDGATVTGGTVWFYSPGGIVAGAGAVFDVGSLLLSTVSPSFAANGGIALALDGGGSPVTIEDGARIEAAGYAALAGPAIVQHGAIETGGSLVLAAADAATIDFAGGRPDVSLLSGAGTIDAASLTSGGDLVARARDMTLGSATSGGGALDLAATGRIGLDSGAGQSIRLSGEGIGARKLVAGNGTLAIDAGAGGAALGTLYAGGAIAVTSGGDIAIDDAVSRTSLLVASTDGAITLGAASTLLDTPQPLALSPDAIEAPADGGISLYAAGPITLNGPVTARGALLVNTGGAATFLGGAFGSTIDIGSADIDIRAGAQVGSGAGTTLVRFTVQPGIRSVIGGAGADAPAGSYVITDAELDRVQAGSIILNAGQAGADPNRPADVTVDALSLGRPDGGDPGNFFGPSALFRIQTPGTMEIVGQSSFTHLIPADRVEFIAGDTLRAIAPAATVSLTGGPDAAPTGTLLFQANRIIVATEAAAREVQQLNNVADRADRLSQSDGVNQPLGYLRADTLLFRVGNALYIQNSGGNTPDGRAGFTVGPGGVTITAIGAALPEVLINGRGVDANGNTVLTGRDLVSVVGGLAPGSSANGCEQGSVFCSDIRDVMEQAAPGLAATNENTLENQTSEEAREKASFRPRVPALIEVRGIAAPSAPPVIDSPVTGTGNDDLWTGPAPVTSGEGL